MILLLILACLVILMINITVRYDNKTYIIETVNGSASLSVDNIC